MTAGTLTKKQRGGFQKQYLSHSGLHRCWCNDNFEGDINTNRIPCFSSMHSLFIQEDRRNCCCSWWSRYLGTEKSLLVMVLRNENGLTKYCCYKWGCIPAFGVYVKRTVEEEWEVPHCGTMIEVQEYYRHGVHDWSLCTALRGSWK